ncbi:hypothetical protein [Lentzea sp. NPDC051838]|uniref:hypothetical protein n=1 Tax=Lentzea sp. NPDC051838 TaxID=3154849 RepID=UPI00341AB0AE
MSDRLGVAVLRFLAKQPPSDVMGEMAREVLSGRTTLHEVMRSSAYSEALTEAAAEAVRAIDAMTPEERRAAEEMGEQAVADVLDPPPPAPEPRRAPVDHDWDEAFTSPWDQNDHF